MEELIKWVCTSLLMDPFEYVFWLHILSQDAFDIIVVRDTTQMGHELKYDMLMLYIGLHLKMHLN